MQKVFKIERVNPFTEFKDSIKRDYKNKRRNRNSKRFNSHIQDKTIKKLIEKQLKLHKEEKELLKQKEVTYTATILEEVFDDESVSNIQMLKSESVLTLDQETKDTNNQPETSQEQELENSKTTMNWVDATIWEGLAYIQNAALVLESRGELQYSQRLPNRTELTPEYTLVLDLDETLVHWSISPFEGYDEILQSVYISYRPFLIDFLEKVSQYFEVVVFTASEEEYATMVLDRIDPEHKYIHHRLFRDSCLPISGNYIKDLNVLGRDINKTIIIDNSVIAFSLNIDNGIPIHSFTGDKQDTELHKLIQILNYAMSMHCGSIESPVNTEKSTYFNIREYLTTTFGLRKWSKL